MLCSQDVVDLKDCQAVQRPTLAMTDRWLVFSLLFLPQVLASRELSNNDGPNAERLFLFTRSVVKLLCSLLPLCTSQQVQGLEERFLLGRCSSSFSQGGHFMAQACELRLERAKVQVD